MKQGHEVKPQFTNLFQMYVDQNFTRLIFGDAVNATTEPSFHSAVVLLTKDAVELATKIQELAKQHAAAAMAAAPPAEQK